MLEGEGVVERLVGESRAKDGSPGGVKLDPNAIDFPDSVTDGSVSRHSSVITVPSVMLAMFWSPSKITVADVLFRIATPLTLLGIYIAIVTMMPGALPLDDFDHLKGLLGGMLVLVGSTIPIFQVDYVYNLVYPEHCFGRVIISDGLATRSSFMIFWILRTFAICVLMCPAYLIYHYGVGYDNATAGPAVLTFLLFSLSCCTMAMMASLIAGPKLAPGVYGGYSALQILTSGLIVPLPTIPVYWRWAADINPLRYMINALIKLEMEGDVPVMECAPYHPEALCPTGAVVLREAGYDDASLALCIGFLLLWGFLAFGTLWLLYDTSILKGCWCTCARRRGAGTVRAEGGDVLPLHRELESMRVSSV